MRLCRNDASVAAAEMRPLLVVLSVVILASAWLGPLPALTPVSFTAHMTMHVMVVAVAAPLLALGLAGTRFDPTCYAPVLLAPVSASVLEMVVVWAWHAPGLHHASRHHAWALMLEQALFLVVGLLVWLSAYGGENISRPNRAASGIVGLLLASMHMTLLGALLALSPRPLYGHMGQAAFGLTVLEDQQLGGVFMLLVAGTVYLLGGLVLLGALLRNSAAAVARRYR